MYIYLSAFVRSAEDNDLLLLFVGSTHLPNHWRNLEPHRGGGGSEESAEQHHVCERAGEQARRIVEWWLLGDYTALCVSLRTSWTENDGFVLPCVGLHCDQDDSAKGFMAGCVCVCVCGVQVST